MRRELVGSEKVHGFELIFFALVVNGVIALTRLQNNQTEN